MVWIAICFISAFFQAIRNGLQKSITNIFPVEIVTWTRFLFGLPYAVLFFILLHSLHFHLHFIPNEFYLYCLIGSSAQLLGNLMLMALFSHRNFVVGITYSKSEALLSALLGAFLFGEYITMGGVAAIVLGFFGIILISMVEQHKSIRSYFKALIKPSALLGLGCGIGYAMSGLMIRKANLSLEADHIIMRASYTLVIMLTLQSMMLGSWILLKHRAALSTLRSGLRKANLIGLSSTLSSIGWFTAFCLAKAPYVMAVGQIEVLFSVVMTHKIFKESVNKLELSGMLMVVGSIVLLMFVH